MGTIHERIFSDMLKLVDDSAEALMLMPGYVSEAALMASSARFPAEPLRLHDVGGDLLPGFAVEVDLGVAGFVGDPVGRVGLADQCFEPESLEHAVARLRLALEIAFLIGLRPAATAPFALLGTSPKRSARL